MPWLNINNLIHKNSTLHCIEIHLWRQCRHRNDTATIMPNDSSSKFSAISNTTMWTNWRRNPTIIHIITGLILKWCSWKLKLKVNYRDFAGWRLAVDWQPVLPSDWLPSVSSESSVLQRPLRPVSAEAAADSYLPTQCAACYQCLE